MSTDIRGDSKAGIPVRMLNAQRWEDQEKGGRPASLGKIEHGRDIRHKRRIAKPGHQSWKKISMKGFLYQRRDVGRRGVSGMSRRKGAVSSRLIKKNS